MYEGVFHLCFILYPVPDVPQVQGYLRQQPRYFPHWVLGRTRRRSGFPCQPWVCSPWGMVYLIQWILLKKSLFNNKAYFYEFSILEILHSYSYPFDIVKKNLTTNWRSLQLHWCMYYQPRGNLTIFGLMFPKTL